MWPTVSYCCMSSFHRKGMNWRHSRIMKIVCIFLNWESSLRLHRVVLLHITWEGKNTFFFCSNNNLLSDTIYLCHSCVKRKLLRIETVHSELLFQGSFTAAVSKWSRSIRGKTKPSTTYLSAASLVCVRVLLLLLLLLLCFSPLNCSLKRRKRKEKDWEHSAME